ncbi:MAG: ATP-dependent sacrificial sulfur transferase LarE [Lachnospiraceae bacterium]|nr:ATP-dependent sacrificial sulfur transferase LarE [Lachnospiraceae bacterium]
MNLKTFFTNNPKVALAFSGGVDSAYLMYAAKLYGADIKAYYVKSDFQPQFEYDDAIRLSKELGVEMKVINLDVLDDERIKANPKDRCYFCKNRIFSAILEEAKKDGYSILLDGTNASDEEGDRPGMRALRELQVKSPLREAGLTKDEIRQLSKESGLFTWNKPAYACLATRICTGETISKEKLNATENSENFLFSLGFKDFRVRLKDGVAKLQFKEEQLEKAMQLRKVIVEELKKYYSSVTLDLEVR